mmetsp:Transcript_13075/g.29725  ORF Transcript_13075/g.29725 Transcript_13075/m.29725 type:complete len:283 (+) Transcript_13075:78-926(+)
MLLAIMMSPWTVACAEQPSWWLPGMPPHEIPTDQQAAFTMNNTIPVAHMYVDDSMAGNGTHYKASIADIERMIDHFRKALSHPHRIPRQQTWIFEALRLYPVAGLRVAVFGSIEPVVEAMLLAHGAVHVTTVEYNRLTYDHPKLSQVQMRSISSWNATFDVVVSLSSFDHDGLGRYGDPVNPEADLTAMEALQHIVRCPGGFALLSVPVGPDILVWNLHRRYGRLRLPLFLAGWHVLDRFGWEEERMDLAVHWRHAYEPVQALRPEGCQAALNSNRPAVGEL